MAVCNGRMEDHENYDRLKLLESERGELGRRYFDTVALIFFVLTFSQLKYFHEVLSFLRFIHYLQEMYVI